MFARLRRRFAYPHDLGWYVIGAVATVHDWIWNRRVR